MLVLSRFVNDSTYIFPSSCFALQLAPLLAADPDLKGIPESLVGGVLAALVRSGALNVRVVLVDIRGRKARMGFEASHQIVIHRDNVVELVSQKGEPDYANKTA